MIVDCSSWSDRGVPRPIAVALRRCLLENLTSIPSLKRLSYIFFKEEEVTIGGKDGCREARKGDVVVAVEHGLLVRVRVRAGVGIGGRGQVVQRNVQLAKAGLEARTVVVDVQLGHLQQGIHKGRL